jgi:hypothetical protein
MQIQNVGKIIVVEIILTFLHTEGGGVSRGKLDRMENELITWISILMGYVQRQKSSYGYESI